MNTGPKGVEMNFHSLCTLLLCKVVFLFVFYLCWSYCRFAAGGKERLPRLGRAGVAAPLSGGSAKFQSVQGGIGDLLVGVGQGDPAGRLPSCQLVLKDLCG